MKTLLRLMTGLWIVVVVLMPGFIQGQSSEQLGWVYWLDWSQDGTRIDYLGGLVQIIVPAPSLERLRLLTERCGMADVTEGALLAQAEMSHLPAFIQQVETLNEDQIPPGCAADLIAVAQALQAQGE